MNGPSGESTQELGLCELESVDKVEVSSYSMRCVGGQSSLSDSGMAVYFR